MLFFFGIDPLTNLFGHENGFAGSKAFEQLVLKPFLLKALQVLTDEPTDIVARRTVVGRQGALFNERREIFGKRYRHRTGKAG